MLMFNSNLNQAFSELYCNLIFMWKDIKFSAVKRYRDIHLLMKSYQTVLDLTKYRKQPDLFYIGSIPIKSCSY